MTVAQLCFRGRGARAQTAVNTIVDAAHSAAADDGLRDTSVVNIEMGGAGGGGHWVVGSSLIFLLFPIIYPMYGVHYVIKSLTQKRVLSKMRVQNFDT